MFFFFFFPPELFVSIWIINEILENVGYISEATCQEKTKRFLSPLVHHPTRLSWSVQDRLTVEAPKRHKVSVHVLSREMDSCEYM